MLAELAAANAAFGVIKSFISNGKELSGCAKQISDFVFAKEGLEKKAKQKKEEELKQMMIYLGRPGLWQDWQEFQAEARKSRRYQEKMAQKRQEEIIEYVGYSIGFIIIVFFAGLAAWFVAKWTGRL
jgi:predicted house-cleaning noncanonical NTP pyrophosphatase (MazG superfamily)